MLSTSFRSQSSSTLSDRAPPPPKESRLKERNSVKKKKNTQLGSVLESNDDDDPTPGGCVELSLEVRESGSLGAPPQGPNKGFLVRHFRKLRWAIAAIVILILAAVGFFIIETFGASNDLGSSPSPAPSSLDQATLMPL